MTIALPLPLTRPAQRNAFPFNIPLFRMRTLSLLHLLTVLLLVNPLQHPTGAVAEQQPNGGPPAAPCLLAAACFAYDMSNSVSDADYLAEVNGVVRLARVLSLLSAGSAYVSAHGFASESALVQAPTRAVLTQFAPRVRSFARIFGRTDMSTGLSACARSLRSTPPDAPNGGGARVVVLLTDGEDFGTATVPTAARLKRQGVRVVTVGIGKRVNEEYLQRLASSPTLYFGTSFFDVVADAARIARQTCNSVASEQPPAPATRPPPATKKPAQPAKPLAPSAPKPAKKPAQPAKPPKPARKPYPTAIPPKNNAPKPAGKPKPPAKRPANPPAQGVPRPTEKPIPAAKPAPKPAPKPKPARKPVPPPRKPKKKPALAQLQPPKNPAKPASALKPARKPAAPTRKPAKKPAGGPKPAPAPVPKPRPVVGLCQRAYLACGLKFRHAARVPTLRLGRADVALTSKIESRQRGERVGVVNANRVHAEVVRPHGAPSIPIAHLGLPVTAFKPLPIPGTPFASGIGMQALDRRQIAAASGMCIRVFVSQYEVLGGAKTTFVKQNRVVGRKANKCIVFRVA